MSILMMAVMVVLALVIGGVIDFASLGNQKKNLQDVADGAAIAAAREMMVAKATDKRVQSIADSYVAANYKGAGAKDKAAVVEKGRAVQVTLSADPKVYFPGPIGANARRMTASATAEIVGGGNVCMVGLNQNAPSTLNMANSARLTASDCAIYSNSRSSGSLTLHNMARVKANLICVAGGIDGPASAATPKPLEDCPPIEDPLKDHVDPKYGLLSCDHLATVIALATVHLKPGVYCGGITVALNGHAILDPGVYVINNGLLAVTLNGTLEGTNVGFYLTGALSTILFTPNTTIDLTATQTGELAGILFFEDRDTLFATYHHIQSNNARHLVGTMYFPNSKLLIDANNPVADRSEYTVIIAKEFELRDGPELVLNTNYGASPIPLPDGVGNKGRPTVRLSK
jgi:Flp pilus assembly protein TadG